MAVRTTENAVRALLDSDWDGKRSLTAFISTASKITDRVATCATNRGHTLDSEELELIERWLSAWAYCMSDQPYSSRSTGGRSGTFQGQTTMRIEANKYGQAALALDTSGCLNAINLRAYARSEWLGKPPSEQTDYDQRD